MRLEPIEKTEFNTRFLVHLDDGARVEAVLYRGDSLCVSTQVGCAVACPFCASGANGLRRGLSLQELIDQVSQVREQGHVPRRVTLSGVGEPLHNHEACRQFVDWCRATRLAPSLTSSGGPLPRLEQWLTDIPHNGLTLSIHAGSEAARTRAVPRAPALQPLFERIASCLPRMSRSRRRKVALAYLLVSGLNDSDDELDAFARRVREVDLDVHLYAYNPVATSQHSAVPRQAYEHAWQRLRDAGLTVRMSSKARLESNGGCGTLIASPPSPGPTATR